MDKQKQIEEMANDMLDYGMEGYPTFDSVFTETKLREQIFKVFLGYAERLIKKGYRKIPEIPKNTVLTADDIAELLTIVAKDTRKETAEKFAQRLKAKLRERFEWLKEKESFALDKDNDTAFNCFYNRKQEVGFLNTIIDEIYKEITEGKV